MQKEKACFIKSGLQNLHDIFADLEIDAERGGAYL